MVAFLDRRLRVHIQYCGVRGNGRWVSSDLYFNDLYRVPWWKTIRFFSRDTAPAVSRIASRSASRMPEPGQDG